MALPTVPYHYQEKPCYCGPACLRMVIDSLGFDSQPQDVLYGRARSAGRLDTAQPWWTPPDGLAVVLRADTQPKVTDCQVTAEQAELRLTRRCIWSLFAEGVAPVVLVYGWNHWVVLVAYDTSQDPEGPDDETYTIRAVEIHNPWRTDPNAPPPPPPATHIALQEWRETYLRKVPRGHWKGRMLAVGVFRP